MDIARLLQHFNKIINSFQNSLLQYISIFWWNISIILSKYFSSPAIFLLRCGSILCNFWLRHFKFTPLWNVIKNSKVYNLKTNVSEYSHRRVSFFYYLKILFLNFLLQTTSACIEKMLLQYSIVIQHIKKNKI